MAKRPSYPVRLDINRNRPPFIYPILSASLSKISGEKINTTALATQSPSVTRLVSVAKQLEHRKEREDRKGSSLKFLRDFFAFFAFLAVEIAFRNRN